MIASEIATPNKVILSPSSTPGFTHAENLSVESANLTSELLTINHDRYHTRWKATLHNHIAHHLLALWALGATPAEIQDMYDYNVPYQAPVHKDGEVAEKLKYLDLREPKAFKECLGKDECYADYLAYFENEVAELGVPAVIRKYVLNSDDRAVDIHGRMYADLVHPIIHLGCGIEFNQPSIVAEALAGACVHEDWPKTLLVSTEEHIRSNTPVRSVPLLQVLENLQADPAIANGVKDSDPFNKIPDGFLKRVSAEQLAPYLAQFQITPTPEGLQRGLTDIMYTAAYMIAAAQRPDKRVFIDFVTLHAATLSVFYPSILVQDWLSDEEKARLLEAKARIDAVMYAGTGCPAFYPKRVLEYEPLHPEHGWRELFHRAIVYRDEGHAAKLIRALYATEQLSAPPPADLPISKEHIITIAHMAMDSIENAFEEGGSSMPDQMAETMAKRIGFGGEMVVYNQIRWVFYSGLKKAWDFKPSI